MNAPPEDQVSAQAAVAASDEGFANMRARCAQRDITLCIAATPDGRRQYLTSRWGWFRAFDDLPAVTAWLERMGGPR